MIPQISDAVRCVHGTAPGTRKIRERLLTQRAARCLAAIRESGFCERYATEVHVGPVSEARRPEIMEVVVGNDWHRVQSASQGNVRVLGDFAAFDDALNFLYWQALESMDQLCKIDAFVSERPSDNLPDWEWRVAYLKQALRARGIRQGIKADVDREAASGWRYVLTGKPDPSARMPGPGWYDVFEPRHPKDKHVARIYHSGDAIKFVFYQLSEEKRCSGS